MDRIYHFPVQIYYEDTDHSGVVYHANYLKYFERAREHVIGTQTLVKLLNEQGLGFAVYKAEIGYFEGAAFGDELDIRTRVKRDSAYRVIWFHEAWLPNHDKPAVSAKIELVCLDRNKQLKPIPDLDF